MPLSLSPFLCPYSGEVVSRSKALPVGSLCLRPPAYIALLFLPGLVHRPGAYVLPGLHLSTGGLWWGAGCLMGTTICSCIDALSLRVPPGLWVGRARYRSLCLKTGRAHEWRATRLHSGGQLHRAMHVSRDASVRKTKAPAQPSWGLPILRLFRPVFRRQFLQLPL